MSIIIRLQNLPWSANAGNIRQFFEQLSIPEGGVHIVGGENGDAFIAFSSDEDARQAMLRDGGAIKGNKVKLLLSSRSEMQKVIETARQQALQLQNILKLASQTKLNPADLNSVINNPAVQAALPSVASSISELKTQGAKEPSVIEGARKPNAETVEQEVESVLRKSRSRSRSGSRSRRSRKGDRDYERSRRDRSYSRDRNRRRSRSNDRGWRQRDRYGRDTQDDYAESSWDKRRNNRDNRESRDKGRNSTDIGQDGIGNKPLNSWGESVGNIDRRGSSRDTLRNNTDLRGESGHKRISVWEESGDNNVVREDVETRIVRWNEYPDNVDRRDNRRESSGDKYRDNVDFHDDSESKQRSSWETRSDNRQGNNQRSGWDDRGIDRRDNRRAGSREKRRDNADDGGNKRRNSWDKYEDDDRRDNNRDRRRDYRSVREDSRNKQRNSWEEQAENMDRRENRRANSRDKRTDNRDRRENSRDRQDDAKDRWGNKRDSRDYRRDDDRSDKRNARDYNDRHDRNEYDDRNRRFNNEGRNHGNSVGPNSKIPSLLDTPVSLDFENANQSDNRRKAEPTGQVDQQVKKTKLESDLEANSLILKDQGRPPTGMPATGTPPTGMPPIGMLPTGLPPTGMPPTGVPPAGMPAAGIHPTGMPKSDMPPVGMMPFPFPFGPMPLPGMPNFFPLPPIPGGRFPVPPQFMPQPGTQMNLPMPPPMGFPIPGMPGNANQPPTSDSGSVSRSGAKELEDERNERGETNNRREDNHQQERSDDRYNGNAHGRDKRTFPTNQHSNPWDVEDDRCRIFVQADGFAHGTPISEVKKFMRRIRFDNVNIIMRPSPSGVVAAFFKLDETRFKTALEHNQLRHNDNLISVREISEEMYMLSTNKESRIKRNQDSDQSHGYNDPQRFHNNQQHSYNDQQRPYNNQQRSYNDQQRGSQGDNNFNSMRANYGKEPETSQGLPLNSSDQQKQLQNISPLINDPRTNATDCVELIGFKDPTDEQTVRKFFKDVNLKPKNVHLRNGAVFAEFENSDAAKLATNKDNTKYEDSIINVRLVSQLVAEGKTDRPLIPPPTPPNFQSNIPSQTKFGPLAPPPIPFGVGIPQNILRTPRLPGTVSRPEDFGKPGCVLAMMNIPYNASIDDILKFFEGYGVERGDVLRRFDDQGNPRGEARVNLKSEENVDKALVDLRGRCIFNREIILNNVA